MRSLLALFPVLLLAACKTPERTPTWDVPLTLQTIGPAYADYAIETVDRNRDERLTMVEWTTAGGTPRSFELVDENRDGVVTRTELIRFGSSTAFFDKVRRYADFNSDSKLTPRDFRSPAGIRLLRHEF